VDYRRGQLAGGIRVSVDSFELATLIISALEGSLMASRAAATRPAAEYGGRHLEEHLEASVRAKQSKSQEKKS
jgi:hypothetical protein